MKLTNKIFIFYLILLQILVIIRNIQIESFQTFFYFCNHIPILIIIFLIYKKYNYLKALINIGFLIQFGWILDFFSKLIFDYYLFGSTFYIFENLLSFSSLISILIHTTTLIPLFFIIKKEKTNEKSLYYSIIYLIFIFLLTILFTNPLYDINCVFNACQINFLQINYFTWIYLPLTIISIILPTYFIQKHFEKCEMF